MKNRILELDYVRALSMLAIIALHVSGPFIFSESSFKLFGMNGAFIINQLMRFAVPAFITLSGLSLGYSKHGEPPIVFYKGRLSKAVIPYIIWYSVYFAYNCLHNGGGFSAGAFFKGLLTGSAAPHLYFMVVIIQLYIIFPALSLLLEKYKAATLFVSFVLTLYFQLGIYLKYFSLHIIPRFLEPNAWLLFPTWIFYFAAGIIISGSIESLIALAKKRLAPILAITLIFGFLIAYEGKFFGTYELSIRPQLIIYTALVLLLVAGIAALCIKSKALNKGALFLSRRSMTVYFVHILILYFFRERGIFQRGLSGMLLLYFSVTFLSIAAAALINLCVSIFQRGRSDTEVSMKC